MGRKKITIRQISDPKLRHITFNKRKNGLIKKAAELSLLCNVNMLLVFEDGAGNLVQFSKNKISNISAFFQECKYNNLVELTAKEYPNFFKVNHYKKHKYQDKDSQPENDNDKSDSYNNPDMYSFTPTETKQEQVKNITKEMKPREAETKKEIQQQVNPFLPTQSKTETINNSFMENERMNVMANSQAEAPGQKSKSNNKTKQAARGNATKPEEGNKQSKIPAIENPVKIPFGGPDHPEGPYNPYNGYKKDPFQEEQIKQINDKNMEYNASTFINPNIDSIKRLGGVPDSMNSPFNFYPANGRLRPFNNFSLGPFSNEEAFSSMLKSYSSFGFPMPNNQSFMGKPPSNGEIDEKLFDTAKMLNYLNQQAGTTPLNRQNMFNFPPNDFSKMAAGDVMRPGGNRVDPDFHKGYGDEAHDDMPPVYKGGYEGNLPNANLNGRRYNPDGYFSTFEEDYGGEKQKKLKHN